jgi:HK97 gp10 family phage protein
MATDGITWTLTGADGIERRLRTFAPRLQKKALRAAARRSMTIVRDAARANARQFDDPETGTQVWRLITVREGRMREPGILMRVGVAGGARSRRSKDPPWYWRLIEFGTEKMRARPFMRPALENNAQTVASKFVTELDAQIDKLPVA